MIKIGDRDYNLYLINTRDKEKRAKVSNIFYSEEIYIEADPKIEYALFRAEGAFHKGTKENNWGSLYYLLLEKRPKFAICFSNLGRPYKVNLSEFLSQSWNEQLFSGRKGVDRFLLCKITKNLKKDYLPIKDEVKDKIKELIKWKRGK